MNFRLWFVLGLLILTAFSAFAEEIGIPFQKTPGQNYQESPVMMIDSMANPTLTLKMKGETAETARLYWITSYDQRFDQMKSLWFFVKPGEHTYYFNIPSQSRYWIGWIRRLIIVPEGPGQIAVLSATIGQGTLLTTLASGWQEFWGPEGRVQTGFSINVTHSSPLFGNSINVYLYWLVGLAFTLALIFSLVKLKPKTPGEWTLPYLRATKTAIIAMIAVWIFLTINSDYNFSLLFKNNFQKYFGKSIEQKHAEAYGEDYYEFLKFAVKTLPQKPVLFSVYSSTNASGLAARLFLVPHVFADDIGKKPEYILVFFPTPDQIKQLQGRPIYKKLDNNKYIVRGK